MQSAHHVQQGTLRLRPSELRQKKLLVYLAPPAPSVISRQPCTAQRRHAPSSLTLAGRALQGSIIRNLVLTNAKLARRVHQMHRVTVVLQQ